MSLRNLLSAIANLLATGAMLVAYVVVAAVIINFLFGDCRGDTPPPWVPKTY